MTKFTKYKNCLLILIFVSVFTYVTNDELKGIFRIDSVSNGNTLTDENYRLQFDKLKEKTSQNFRITKNQNNLYYIENKSHNKIAVNQNGHVLMMYNPNDSELKKTMEWNFYFQRFFTVFRNRSFNSNDIPITVFKIHCNFVITRTF